MVEDRRARDAPGADAVGWTPGSAAGRTGPPAGHGPIVQGPIVHGPIVRFEPVGPAADAGLLTAAEIARRDRLQRSADRAAYVAAHVLVRRCVAELTGSPPEAVRIAQSCGRCGEPGHGRPSVLGDARVHVSLSHSSRHVAAIAAFRPVGIDVETIEDQRTIAEVLSERERAWVATQHAPGRSFRRLWVRKEALIKSGAASLEEAADLDVLARRGARGLEPDSHRFTEWSAADAVGAWVMPPKRRGAGHPPARR